MHPMKRAKLVRQWRQTFALLALEATIPSLEEVSIIVTPYAKDRRWRADVGAAAPCAKACIDGLTDAGVFPDDNPDYVKYLGFHAPVIGKGDGLEIEITGIKSGESQKGKKLPYRNGTRK